MNVVKLKEMFLKNFVFGFVEDIEDVVLRSQHTLALEVLVQLCEKSEKLANMKVSEIVDFFDINGSEDDLQTYTKIENVWKEAKELDDAYSISNHSDTAKLRYFKAMSGAFEQYLTNRNETLEEAFQLLIDNNIDAGHVRHITMILDNNVSRDIDKMNKGLKNSRYYIAIAEKLEVLKEDPTFSSLDAEGKSYRLRVAFDN